MRSVHGSPDPRTISADPATHPSAWHISRSWRSFIEPEADKPASLFADRQVVTTLPGRRIRECQDLRRLHSKEITPDAGDARIELDEDDLAIRIAERVSSRASERLDNRVVYRPRIVLRRPPLRAVEREERAEAHEQLARSACNLRKSSMCPTMRSAVRPSPKQSEGFAPLRIIIGTIVLSDERSLSGTM